MRRSVTVLAAGMVIAATLLHAAESVNMQERRAELANLKWGMFICWSFSTFSGKEWTPGRERHRRLPRHRLRHRPMGPHRQGSGHGLHPLPHQAPRRLLPLGHQDHGPQGDQGPAGPRRAGGTAEILRQVRHQAGTVLLRWASSPTTRTIIPAATRRKCRRPSSRNSAPSTGRSSSSGWTVPKATAGWTARRSRPGSSGFSPVVSSASTAAGPATCVPARWGGRAPVKDFLVGEFTYPILPGHEGGAMWFYSLPKHDGLCRSAKKPLPGLPRRGEVRQYLLAGRRPRLRRPAAQDRRRDAARRSAR